MTAQLDQITTQLQETGDTEVGFAGAADYRRAAVESVDALLTAAEQAGIDMRFALLTIASGKARLQVLPGGNS